MKKIFQNKNAIPLLTFIIGLIISGTIVVVATSNYEAKSIIYTKDGNSKTVQDVIEDLYDKSKNHCPEGKQCLNDNQYNDLQNTYLNECPNGYNCLTNQQQQALIGIKDLPVGTVNVLNNKITIPYTGTYKEITCVYGINNSDYTGIGVTDETSCVFYGDAINTTYYYKIIAIDNDDKIYMKEGNSKTGSTAYYSRPAVVYYNPTSKSSCSNYTDANSSNGVRTGCLKWYRYGETTNSYYLLLDHNLYLTGTKMTGTRTETEAAMETLKTETGWKDLNTRFLSKSEVTGITGVTKVFEYFDKVNCNGKCQAGTNKYWWLFDRVSGCTSYGCITSDSSNYGYWVTWDTYMQCLGANGPGDVGNCGTTDGSRGLRPVITISK